MRKLTLSQFLFPLVSAGLCILFLASCGATKSTTTGAPTAVNPGSGDNTDPLPDDTDPTTAGLPDLTGAVAVALSDNINYTGLSDIAGSVVKPIVGDPKVVLKITNGTTPTGRLRFAFEDRRGFWWTDMTSVASTGANTASSLDIIFSDNLLTVRIAGLKTVTNGNTLNSVFLYRVRQTSETECLPKVCKYNWLGQTFEVPLESCFSTQAAYQTFLTNEATACRNYMTSSSTNTQVKTLGTFQVNYTNIAVLAEGN
ncbi:MAG: hypothetical protein ACKN9V_06495 [Pseudomonadota bacterium]